ncbi:hypothetical protein EMIT0P74_120018 [Pseudomonas sp. IT-P74]
MGRQEACRRGGLFHRARLAFYPITTIGLSMLEPTVLYIPDAIRLHAQEGSVFGCRHF